MEKLGDYLFLLKNQRHSKVRYCEIAFLMLVATLPVKKKKKKQPHLENRTQMKKEAF